MASARDRLVYEVGNENTPGDPFGRTHLVIEPDGRAQLDQYKAGGHKTWSGTVVAGALDRIWKALSDARFPDVPDHDIPGGSAFRVLTAADGRTAEIAYHAAEDMPGYQLAFPLLDRVIRQLSQDTIKMGPAGEKIVEVGAPSSPASTSLTPGSAFLLAYLPWRRIAHTARLQMIDRNAATVDPALRHSIEFSRQALKVEDSMVGETDSKLAALAQKLGVTLPDVRAHLTSPLLQQAYKAGEIARQVSIATALAAHIAYLRTGAPDNADLRSQAADRAKELRDSATALEQALRAMGLPLVASHAHSVPKIVSLTRNLEPTTTGGFNQLNELMRDVDNFIEAHARQLDVPAPSDATSPATAEEQALLAKIIADPSNAALRLDLAKLAAARNDPRAALIRLQLSAGGDTERQQANDLIRSHPEWTAKLQELGARDIKFAGGFPDEITVDAATFLSRGKDLLAAAPLTRIHVRNAKGKVGEIVRSPLLATLEALDLDDAGATDDDIAALATSPHATRLKQLDLRFNPLTAKGIEAIAASPKLSGLNVVTLDGNPADPIDRVEYVDETNTQTVPTDAGKALERKYGPIRWLHPSR